VNNRIRARVNMTRRKHQMPGTQRLKFQAVVHSEIRRIVAGSPMPQEREAQPKPELPAKLTKVEETST
jgi:hypothetical protein